MGIFKSRPAPDGVCACGHGWEAHEHYRRGTECSICDARACSSFTPVAVDGSADADATTDSDSRHHA